MSTLVSEPAIRRRPARPRSAQPTTRRAAAAPNRSALRTDGLPNPGVLTATRSAAHCSLRQFGVLPIHGKMSVRDAALHIDRDPLQSWIRVDLDAETFTTGWAVRDAVLRRDVLAVHEFGVVRFESTQLEEVAPRRFACTGDLYLLDSCLEVTLAVRLVACGPDQLVAAASGSFSRRAAGLFLPPRYERAFLAGDRVQLDLAASFGSG
jgi:polyisoprenoid-binding protein YceI